MAAGRGARRGARRQGRGGWQVARRGSRFSPKRQPPPPPRFPATGACVQRLEIGTAAAKKAWEAGGQAARRTIMMGSGLERYGTLRSSTPRSCSASNTNLNWPKSRSLKAWRRKDGEAAGWPGAAALACTGWRKIRVRIPECCCCCCCCSQHQPRFHFVAMPSRPRHTDLGPTFSR